MPSASSFRFLRRTITVVAIAGGLLGTATTASSAGDLQSEISANRSATASLRSAIAADTAMIAATGGGLERAQARLATLQGELATREAALRHVQLELLAARNRLVDLENRLQVASAALEANLVGRYEQDQPDLVSVILDAHGFTDLLEQVSFLERVGNQDAQIVALTRATRVAVSREATALGVLEQHDRLLTQEVLDQRNQVAALQAALLARQIEQMRHRAQDTAKWNVLNRRLRTLEADAAAQAAQAARAAAEAAAAGRADVGGIAVDTAGMVQAPLGAPPAVAQVIAAANAIATLPYVYGGGHASFHADAYDCSGSVSYALAAAGLVSAPMDSTEFESWGAPGPGRWITIYANAGHVWMEIAGWRFDTVAQAVSGTRWAQGGGEFAGFAVRHPPGL